MPIERPRTDVDQEDEGNHILDDLGCILEGAGAEDASEVCRGRDIHTRRAQVGSRVSPTSREMSALHTRQLEATEVTQDYRKTANHDGQERNEESVRRNHRGWAAL